MGAPKIKIVKDHVKAFEEKIKLLPKYKKNKFKKEWQKAGTCAGVGAVAGCLEGGAIGIAAFGGAVGVPVVVAGAVVGLAGYGLYKGGKSIVKEMKEDQ